MPTATLAPVTALVLAAALATVPPTLRIPSARPAPTPIVYAPRRRYAAATGRARMAREACSRRWREDLVGNKDRDYLGNLTGPGSRKVKCSRCPEAVPPQDVEADRDRRPVCSACRSAARAPRDPTEAKRPAVAAVVTAGAAAVTTVPVVGLPGVSRVALERTVPLRPAVVLRQADRGIGHDFEVVVQLPEYDQDGYDGSGFRAVAVAMADADYVDHPDPLPAAGDAKLAAALAGFVASGDLAGFAGASGETRAEAVQRYRRARYDVDLRAGRVG